MSRENVNVVHDVFDAYTHGIPPQEISHLLAADIVWNPADEAESHGVEELSAYMQRWESEWDDLETSADEFIDAGDRVVVSVYFRGRGKGSGVQVDATLYEVYTLRDGKIVRMDEYTDRAEALEAVGLSE